MIQFPFILLNTQRCIGLTLFVLMIQKVHAQNVGIGTNNPTARLHVADSNVLFTGPLTPPANPGNPPGKGAGARMMWYADKAAFRVGFLDGANSTFWDKDSIGSYSFAAGGNTKAIGTASIALGYYTSAVGGLSTAIGYRSIAAGSYSTAFGFGNSALGYGSTAMGSGTSAMGDYSTTIGYGTVAKAPFSVSLGLYNDITDNPLKSYVQSGDRIFQIGNGYSDITRSNALTVLRNGNVGIGITTPNAQLQFGNNFTNRKIVLWETANNEHQFYGLGIQSTQLRYQVDANVADHVFFAATSATTSNELMRIKGTGNVGIGTATPSQALQVAGNIIASGTITPSDARYKKNIASITDPLEKLEQLNGVTYNYRKEEFPEMKFTDKEQVGLIAQDVEKVFPQLVFEDDNGYKAVDYVKLIPLLIEALKSQQKEIEALKDTIKKK